MSKHPTIELLEGLNGALIYVLESATCLAILYLAYHFLLRKEKSFHYNRFYLLAAIFFSVSFPLIEIGYNPANTPAVLNSIHQVGNEVGNEPIIEANKAYSYTITAKSERPFMLWWEILLMIYVSGVIIGLLKLFLQIRSFKDVTWFKRHNTRYRSKEGFFLVNTDGTMPTFSFFNYLFWDNTLELNELEKKQMLDHEKVHIREKHSLDIMFIQVLKILFWFNPLLYLYRMLLEETHEYAADRKVAAQTGASLYTQLLVKTVFKKMGLQHGSYFRKNQTLKRVNMLGKNKKVNVLRLFIPLPLMALLFFVFSFEADLKDKVFVESYQLEEDYFTASDIVPSPVKGMKAWEDFLEDNISYPKKAVKANVEGKVVVSFTINKKGLIEGLSFDQKLGHDCELEVVNALARAGKWNPGIKDGELTNARIKLPIEFKKKS